MRSDDDYRAMMDTIDLLLKDQNSMFQKARLSLSNSLTFTLDRLNPFKSEVECKSALEKRANESVMEQRKKLDHQICHMLQQRYHLAPGDLRKQFDHCWSHCLTSSFNKYTEKNTFNESVTVSDVMVGVNLINAVYNIQLMSIVSEAWEEYLKGIRSIIDRAWQVNKHV